MLARGERRNVCDRAEQKRAGNIPMFNRIFAIAVPVTACVGVARAEWTTIEAFPTRDAPHGFDYYAMVLSWSPTHCSTTDRGTDDGQCARDDGARFGFVCTGCGRSTRRAIPRAAARAGSPSYRTRSSPALPTSCRAAGSSSTSIPHGTCSGLRPDALLRAGAQLFNRVNIPARYRNPLELQLISPREARGDFLRANPGCGPT